MHIYGYVCMCLCIYTYILLPGKSNFLPLVTIMKYQDLAEDYVHGWHSTYIYKFFLFISNHYCFFYLQNNYNKLLAFVIWAIMRECGAS